MLVETSFSGRMMSSMTDRKMLSGMALSGTQSMMTAHVSQSSSHNAAMQSRSAHVLTSIGR